MWQSSRSSFVIGGTLLISLLNAYDATVITPSAAQTVPTANRSGLTKALAKPSKSSNSLARAICITPPAPASCEFRPCPSQLSAAASFGPAGRSSG
jgi:hypothetical protein